MGSGPVAEWTSISRLRRTAGCLWRWKPISRGACATVGGVSGANLLLVATIVPAIHIVDAARRYRSRNQRKRGSNLLGEWSQIVQRGYGEATVALGRNHRFSKERHDRARGNAR